MKSTEIKLNVISLLTVKSPVFVTEILCGTGKVKIMQIRESSFNLQRQRHVAIFIFALNCFNPAAVAKLLADGINSVHALDIKSPY